METEAQKQARYRRIRYLKRILRPMPRRYNLHKYPILKWFAASARKRDYLWSLRDSNMIRAIYIGWFIAFIPVYGLQMILAFVFCFLLKANCLVAMALQWITNPLTMACPVRGNMSFHRTCDNFLAFRRQSCATYVDNDSQRIRRESTKKEVCAWELKPWLLSFRACSRRVA